MKSSRQSSVSKTGDIAASLEKQVYRVSFRLWGLVLALSLLCPALAPSQVLAAPAYNAYEANLLKSFDTPSNDPSNNLNWDTSPVYDNNYNNWTGVTWVNAGSDDYRVQEILISSKGLSGTLDLNSLISLTRLNVDNNALTALDVTHNTALTYLYAYTNDLTALDVTHNTALTRLDVDENSLTVLDVTHNTALTILSVGGNALTALDVSNNTALTELNVRGNALTALDVTHNTALTELSVWDNALTALDVTHNTALTHLNVDNNALTALDVTHNTALTHLDVHNNALTALDVTHNTALEYLYVGYNALTTLDVTHNTALVSLDVYSNALTALDVSNNAALEFLDVSYNQITDLDLTYNKLLYYLIISGDIRITSMEVNILEKFDYGKAILNNNSVVKSWANIYQGGLIVGETAAKSGVTLNGNVLVTNNYNNYLNIEPWLGGHGKIIGEAEIGSSEMRGALSPGNSNIGTLTIDGNLSFASKGYYDVEINKDYSDKAVVTGTATLDGILRLFSLEGSLANYVDKAKEWLILDSQILVGEFKSITSDFDFLGPKLRYDTNLANVYLSFDNIISKNRNTIPQISDNKIVTLNFTFLEEGDIHYSVANKISYRPLALNEVNSVMKAGKYWANMLSNYKTKRDDLYFDVYTVNEENAFAGSNSWSAADESFNNTVYAFMDAKELGPLPSISPNCEEFSLSCASSHGRIGIGFSSEHWTYDVNRNQNVMPWNLETTIIHELGHAFGIVGDTPAGVNGSAQNGFGPSKYEALLQDPDAPPIVKSVSYKYYYSDFYNLDPTTRNFTDWRANNASEHSQAVQYIFNLYKNININGDKYDIDAIEYGDTIVATAVRYINVNNGTKIQVGFDSRYFPAELRPHDDPLWIPAITATYNPADFDGYFHGKTAVTVYNDGNYDPNRAVPMEDEAHEQVESHFGLRNTLMTHRNFRNYASLIEVELAAFVDLGLPVDLKQYFGRSVYTSDNSSDKSIIDNHSYLLPDNKYSIGIHLYGDNNHFTQRGNIRVNGDASVGIRSDGYLNTINIAPNSTISANGAQGTGLLVAYGHDTNVNHQGHIEATGQGGVAAFFDIGVNMVDENYTDDGYGDYAQYSYYKVPWYWGDGSYKQEFTQASKYLDGALVNQFNVKGYLEGNLAAIYIGGNSHVNEINIIGNSAEIRGPIINDYYYKSDGRSTKLTFGKAYAVNNHTNNISINNSEPDPSFRFIIKNDILGYGAEVKDGYKGRYSGRGLFDVELHGGKTTLMYDATINVNSFTMESGATLLTTADFGHGLYPTITANDFNLKKGSIVDLDQTFLFGGTLVYNSKHNVLKLVNPEGKYNLLNFANKSETWAEFQTVSVKNIAVGAFDYLADLYWDDDKTTLIMQIVSPPEVSEERSGIQSTESASQMTVNTTTNSQNSVFEHISETSTARRRKRSAPSSGENDQAWALWLAPWYSYDHHDSQYGSEGFSVKSYGLTLGLDHTFQDGSPLIGLALSFGRPEAKSRFINNKGKAFSVSGYFSSALPYEFDVSAIVTYSFFDFDQTRWSDGVDYTADYDSKAVAVTLELGRSFDLSETWTLRPYGQVSYNHSDVDAYSESGRGPQAQVIAGNETDLWRTELGTSVIWNHSDRLTMVGKIGWGRNFKKKNEHTGYFSGDQPNPSYFKIETSPFDKNNVAYGLNAIIAVNDSVDIKLTYDGAASRHNTSHAGAITAVYNF